MEFSSCPQLELREEEENHLPQMKKLFFLYGWLNLTRPECFRDKENLVKHIRKRTIQTGRLFFSSSLTNPQAKRPSIVSRPPFRAIFLFYTIQSSASIPLLMASRVHTQTLALPSQSCTTTNHASSPVPFQ